MIPVQALFEAHLMVSDLGRAIAFYRDVLDFRLATVLPERGVAFFWIGPGRQSMLGLWTGGSAPLRMNLHTAFRTQRDHVLAAPQRLRDHGIEPLDLQGRPTSEPVVIGWMPAVAIYFLDPDDNLLEYIAALEGRRYGAHHGRAGHRAGPQWFDKSVEELIVWCGDDAQRSRIVPQLTEAIRFMTDSKQAMDAALKILEFAPETSFGPHDYLVAQAVTMAARAETPNGYFEAVHPGLPDYAG